MRYGAISVAIVATLLLSTLFGCSSQAPLPKNNSQLHLTRTFLAKQYDPDIGLVRESPNANPNLFFVWSDNYLVSLALDDLDLATRVASYNVPGLDKYRVLAGDPVDPDCFAIASTQLVVEIRGDKTIKTEQPDPSAPMLSDWESYADLLLLSSINYVNLNNKERALEAFEAALAMYDGVGFQDKAFQASQEYATYKLALCIIAASHLKVSRAEIHDMVRSIISLQALDVSSNRYGGIYTEYDSTLSPLSHTDTNTETTALCMLALMNSTTP